MSIEGWLSAQTFATIYQKTSTKESEIFCAFLISIVLPTMDLETILRETSQYCEKWTEVPAYRQISGPNFVFATFLLKISAMEGETFCVFLISIVLPTMDLETFLRELSQVSQKMGQNTDMQVEGWQSAQTFATFYLKISAMEGEIFCAFLISIVWPIMDFETILRQMSQFCKKWTRVPAYTQISRPNFVFATFSLKISAMEGETFCVFLVSIVLPTMDLETFLR